MKKKVVEGFCLIGFGPGVYEREDYKFFDPPENLLGEALEEFDGKKVRVTIEVLKR